LGLTMAFNVRFVTLSGELGPVKSELDMTLLDAAHLAGLNMDATCGGRGRCRSCRVKVFSGELSPPTLQDTLQLGHDEVQERFRLACQTRPMSDCTVAAMPVKAESGFQILSAEAGLVADGRMQIDSGVKKHVVIASTPQGEHHQTADLEEILSQ